MPSVAAEKARTLADEIALADERNSLTWSQLATMLNRAVNALRAMRLEKDARVAILAPNSVEGVVGYLAALHAGISSVPVNHHFTAAEVAYILKDSSSEVVFVGPETAEVGKAAAAAAGTSTVIGWRCPGVSGVIDWQGWLAAAPDAEPPTDIPPRPHLHYTSGTTGRPKGAETPPTMFPRVETVQLLIDTLRAQVDSLGGRSPGMVVSPLYHTGPLGAVRQLAGGLGLVILSRFDAEEVLAAIDRHKVKSVLMVPTHFQRLLALPAETRANYDVSSLVVVSHTGAACPPDVKRRMIDWFGPVLLEAYGATEAGSTNMITSEEWLQKPGSVGKTLPPFELVVVSDDGQPLGPNVVGGLYFRDTTGRGIIYHNDAEKTKSVHLSPGVFTLGEVGYFDDDGYVFITDRTSDMIVSGGVNIYPAEAEQVLLQHPAVADVAAIGVPNPDMGEEVKALIVLRQHSSPPSTRELDQFCRERLAGYKCPRSYEFREDIGRNAMGKINKRELRKSYWPTTRTIGG